MFVRSRDYDNAIAKVTINLGKVFGLQEDGDAFIVLKELPTREMLLLQRAQQNGEDDANEVFWEILPKIIVKHNFYEDDETLMTAEAVRDLIMEKIEAYAKVMNDYTQAAFFTQRKENSES